MIAEGKAKVSWWGGLEPVMIGGADESITTTATSAFTGIASYLGGTSSTPGNTSNVASAEVSISRGAGVGTSAGTNRQTSLQF